jgi:TM2 domain-containing membrane protein YozV
MFKLPQLLIFIICLMLVPASFAANSDELISVTTQVQTEFSDNGQERPSPLFRSVKLKKEKNKRITAALLAFPFPFGIVGIHRIYLGTAPYVPVVYIASLGGVFGILPLIDCIVLLSDSDTGKYINNGRVFMWVD